MTNPPDRISRLARARVVRDSAPPGAGAVVEQVAQAARESSGMTDDLQSLAMRLAERDARIAELEREMDALMEALAEVRDRLVQHPAYAQLTESEEQDIGGDTAEFSYLARVATDAIDAAMKGCES